MNARRVTPCHIEGCTEPRRRRGLCKLHHWRIESYGSPEPRRNSPYKDLNARLWEKADCSDPGGCWIWMAAVNSKGYGTTSRPPVPGQKGRSPRVYAHRLAWEVVNGPIPDGLSIDHICHERRCINPAHLRLADAAEQQQNRPGAQANSKTGHLNVYPLPNGRYAVQVKRTTFGTFGSLAQAAEVAEAARTLMHPFSDPDARREAS